MHDIVTSPTLNTNGIMLSRKTNCVPDFPIEYELRSVSSRKQRLICGM